MNETDKYGFLLTPDIKLHRQYFRELVKLQGIHVLYRAPLPDKHWTTYAEIDSNYAKPILVGCIFVEHPNQQTMKKIGWVAELQENSSLIQVDYDLCALQVGALFIVPSGLDHAKGRLFKVVRMENSMVYPSSIICEIVPEYEDTFDNEDYNFENSDFNLLNEEDDDLFV